MSKSIYLPAAANPGITRDGTPYAADSYTDGKWVRFYRGLPQKIGGYRVLEKGTNEIPRNLYSLNRGVYTLIFVGTGSSVRMIKVISSTLNVVDITDITPQSGPGGPGGLDFPFVPNAENYWTFDSITSEAGETDSVSYLLAFVVPSANNTASDADGYLFSTNLTDLDNVPILVAATITPSDTTKYVKASGSMGVIGRNIFVCGSNGYVAWNSGHNIDQWVAINPPTTANNAGSFNIGTNAFFYITPVRGAQQLTGLIWSEIGLITVTQGGTDNLSYLPFYVSESCTCISPASIVSYDPYYLWVGNNTFWQYTGVVTEIPNTTNKEFFFKNLNSQYQARVFSFLELQYNEWWICFPKGNATECNHAIVYNMQDKFWYDTPFNRSDGIPSSPRFPYPVLGSNVLVNGTYPLYLHEYGVDADDGFGHLTPIESYFTFIFSMTKQSPSVSNAAIVNQVILDIVQKKEMYFYATLYGNPRSIPIVSKNYTFSETQMFFTTDAKASILYLTFGSNILGGSYLMGNTLIEYLITDDLRNEPNEFNPII